MPGGNSCVFPQCTVSQSKKYKGISLFKLPSRNCDREWKKDVVLQIKKFRVIDQALRERIESGKVFICENHYQSSDIEITKTGKKTLRLGAIPSINLPRKSHDSEVSQTARREIQRVLTQPPTSNATQRRAYKDFDEFVKRSSKVKIEGWKYVLSTDSSQIVFNFESRDHLLPKFELKVDTTLEFTLRYFGWLLPDTHQIYKVNKRSLRYTTLSSLILNLTSFQICSGLSTQNHQLLIHSIPLKFSNEDEYQNPNQSEQCFRSKDCHILMASQTHICKCCESSMISNRKEEAKKMKSSEKPASKFAPLSATNPNRVKKALIEERIKNKKLTLDVKRLEKEIEKKGVSLPTDLASDIESILENNSSVSPFMNLFWSEQKKLLHSKNFKYHPMIIRFCLSLAAKSAKAYDELRDSKILVLPSRRTLRDYKNAIRPKAGFSADITKELKEVTKQLSGHQRNVVLSFDEIKVQEDLVFDKHTGELIGFVNLGDPELNFATFDDIDDLATHCLVFYVRGISSDLKFSFSYHATKGASAAQIMSLFWKAVSILELSCDLNVIAAVADGASNNRLFFKMHKGMSRSDSPYTYRTKNIFAPGRYIYFFADVPHLMKTLRNAVYHSRGDGSGTRQLWNGNDIIWNHFMCILNDEMSRGLKLFPKLSQNHIYLTSYSSMTVSYATQILSETMSNLILQYYPEFEATGILCKYMDSFFDCANVRSQFEGKMKRKPFLEPYRSVDDKRFKWLKEDFLSYFTTWRKNIAENKPQLTEKEKDKLFIPASTYIGIYISVHSLIEATQYLLRNGAEFVLTERFNQDVVEEYFGRQRGCGRFNDAPNVYQFGYNDNTIRIQRSVVPVKGNTRGAHVQKRKPSWEIVDNKPLAKRTTKRLFDS